jgi:hypothetical protein
MGTSFGRLNSVFENATTSYKYYWWLSILKFIKTNGNKKLELEDIVFEMLAFVWYPINYYKISLGKQDQLTKYVKEIKVCFNLRDQIDDVKLINFLKENRKAPLIKSIIKKVLKYVPFRFIRPWCPETKGMPDHSVNDYIVFLQKDIKRDLPYIIEGDFILMNNKWLDFISNNHTLIENATLFELFKYVEKNNPLLINISLKLFKPKTRKLAKATKLWKRFIGVQGHLHKSVFEENQLNQINQLSIDHFLPWSFLTHDLIWNLHPVNKSINSSKSNYLPKISFFKQFYYLQYNFCNFLLTKKINKPLEDYYNLFNCSNEELISLSKEQFVIRMGHFYTPKYETAKNMGFKDNWSLGQ